MWNPRVGGEKLGKISAPNIGQGSPPRGRGKGFLAMMVMVPSLGLPPRRRGKDGNEVQLIAAEGITPAWAGKSTRSRPGLPWLWDHPRMGGEKKRFCSMAFFVGDHPRVGGEKAAYLAGLTSGVGSPPRGRGKAVAQKFRFVHLGITPAWAGKSFDSLTVCRRLRDHPRMGGEKSVLPHSFSCS